VQAGIRPTLLRDPSSSSADQLGDLIAVAGIQSHNRPASTAAVHHVGQAAEAAVAGVPLEVTRRAASQQRTTGVVNEEVPDASHLTPDLISPRPNHYFFLHIMPTTDDSIFKKKTELSAVAQRNLQRTRRIISNLNVKVKL